MEGSRDLVNGGGGSGIKFMTGPCSLTQHKGSRSEWEPRYRTRDKWRGKAV